MAPQTGSIKKETQPFPAFLQLFTWEEMRIHNGQGQEQWLVIDRKVYNVSEFSKRHPGGSRVISHYAGQDATDAFVAFHNDKTLVKKYLKSLLIGELAPDQPSSESNKKYLESTWFIWVSQKNHIPMEIDYDKNEDWVSTQLRATCNVNQSTFNDWFTGHLNFQIEHHLFPTMPRHNCWKAAPLVKALCDKHGIQYKSKTLLTAFVDILKSLKDSGEHWLEACLHG
ncbi:acyl-CoA (8-3)-desaturase-like [Rhea pennata]|uniref:acyl-CoA (8-3)-desaturase-like n=1 Tax=Rhea pennata TaxID=8795 RepID=UPI002E2529DF